MFALIQIAVRFKIFQVIITVLRWSSVAFKDGKITYNEALDLGLKLGKIYGLPVGFSVHKNLNDPGDILIRPDNPKEDNES